MLAMTEEKIIKKYMIDQRIDALMHRTENRPLPSGKLDTWHVFAFAVSLAAVAMAILVAFVNVLTAVLTFFSLVGYALIYTLYLKRATPQNIVLGGAAGAAPWSSSLHASTSRGYTRKLDSHRL